jgi:hypothetical protein
MKAPRLITAFSAWWALFFALGLGASPVFEGRINATFTRGVVAETLLYTIGTNQLRIERGEHDHPYPWKIVARDTGDITLLFPHNRSFVRLKNGATNATSPIPNGQVMPPGSDPQMSPGNALARPPIPQMPPGAGPQSSPGMPATPAAPMMPAMPVEQAALTASDQTTNLLGYVCKRYELKQRGEVMEIWATDQLLPFQSWMPIQPHRFGPLLIEEQWPDLLKAKKLFPLLAVLKSESGVQRLRFEVKAIKSEKIEDKDGSLFSTPPDYLETQPLPF